MALIKHKYSLRKRRANLASNIHSYKHLMGLALMAGEDEIYGPTLKMEFPRLRFSALTTVALLVR